MTSSEGHRIELLCIEKGFGCMGLGWQFGQTGTNGWTFRSQTALVFLKMLEILVGVRSVYAQSGKHDCFL